MSQLDVLVVGASIAGTTTAYWLAKAGHNVTIIERFAELRTGGQAVDVRTTGVTVMNKMPGVESAVRAKRPPVDGWSLVNDEGKSFAKIMPSGDPNKQSMISEYEIFRGDLNKILYDVTVDNKRIKYVFDEQVASMKQSGDGDGPITIEFLNGHLPTAEYDLVVSCDGSHSRTRAMGFNCAVRDNLISNNCWAAYCTIKHDLLSASTMAEGHSSISGRFIAVGQKGPPGQNTVMFQRFCSGPGADPTKEFREAQKTGVDALYKYIEKDFQGSGWRTEEILTMVKDAEDLYASELCQVKMPELSRGRFVLVGDAGYSSGVGTGTTLAMTGAYVLAGEISKHQGDLSAGLKGYERVMRPIINDMQKIPFGFATIMAPQTRWGIWFRNIFMSVASKLIDLLAPYFAGAMASTEKYALPDYAFES